MRPTPPKKQHTSPKHDVEPGESAGPFDESPHVGVITTPEILRGEKPILLVVHDRDGSWDFLTGEPFNEETAVAVHLAHIVDLHPEVHELATLDVGWGAERDSTTAPWQRFPLD